MTEKQRERIALLLRLVAAQLYPIHRAIVAQAGLIAPPGVRDALQFRQATKENVESAAKLFNTVMDRITKSRQAEQPEKADEDQRKADEELAELLADAVKN